MDLEVIAFDVFGTLVDWRSSIAAALERTGGRAGLAADWPAVADAWRSRYAPALAAVLSGHRDYQPLDVLHAQMLDDLAPGFGLETLSPGDRAELVRAWHELMPWPDSAPGLLALRERHLLTPLSNGGIGLLTRLARAADLRFDCILSAELAHSYKPDPRVYRLPCDYLGVRPDQVLMVAAHPGDLDGARQAGLRTAYVPRPLEWGPGHSAPAAPAGTDFVADDLVKLADLVREA
jgi:2-haloacid dehalogenase